MTTFLQKYRFDLATAAVVAPLTICGLHRMFPTSGVRFLAVASVINIHVVIAIKAVVAQYTPKSPNGDNKTALFEHLNVIVSISAGNLLPIFARYVGQRMGV